MKLAAKPKQKQKEQKLTHKCQGIAGGLCHSRGFTLSEVMAASLIFSFGMVGVLGLQMATIQASRNAATSSLALNLAEATLERLRTEPFESVTGTRVDRFDRFGASASTSESTTYLVEWQASPDRGGIYTDVDIQVIWAPANAKEVPLESLESARTRRLALRGRIYRKDGASW